MSLDEEPIGDTALVEHLDGAGVRAPGARADEVLTGASLHDGIHAGQRQLAGGTQSDRDE